MIFPKLIFSKPLHSLNIESILVTFEKSKLDKSITFILFKPSNIDSHESISSLNTKVILFRPFGNSQNFLQELSILLFI